MATRPGRGKPERTQGRPSFSKGLQIKSVRWTGCPEPRRDPDDDLSEMRRPREKRPPRFDFGPYPKSRRRGEIPGKPFEYTLATHLSGFGVQSFFVYAFSARDTYIDVMALCLGRDDAKHEG